MDSMMCFQCEQADQGQGCQVVGVCGKDPLTANLQNALVLATKGLGAYAHRARQAGVVDHTADVAMLEALFTTVTNVNFDPADLATRIAAVVATRDALRARVGGDRLGGIADWVPASDLEALAEQGEEAGIEARQDEFGIDAASLQELLTYGLKGLAAYADHALVLGHEDDAVYAYCHEALAYLCGTEQSLDELLPLCLKCGEVNLRVMELLDTANTGTYGHPVPTPVRITPLAGKCILVSGHDLKDLELLLQQTAGLGINVYTHGEMLPAHGYPELKKYAHLVGNYGGAWQEQWDEFSDFPGAILMTTNCIQEPQAEYAERIFTSGLVQWPGVPHLGDGNFAPVIAAAQAAPGFTADGEDQTILVGFGHQTVLSVAGQVLDAVKSGALRHFFLIGGCDGAKPGRSYFTELAEQVPEDCLILTLACGKYRFNKHDFGTLGGLPRLLDMGQCNDAYSAIQVAVALANAVGCGVNDLPLSLVISWYEQKAVAILLTLLHLGIKNIRLGPSLPAFVSPAVLRVLVDNFALAPITTPENDLKAILG
ncbi:MAG: hydroxylamine reductase [Fimbriimonadaceae bacterium]|nr:hydroxylamine reductase [Fimbriimonadaceae bacterium]